MKILFLCSQINQIGGIQKYNRQFLKALAETGEDVLLVEREPGFFAKIKFIFQFFWKAGLGRPDVIICGHIHFSPLCYFWNLFSHQKFIIITYGVEVWNIKSRIYLKAFQKARLIIAVSLYTKEKMLSQLNCPKEKIFVLLPSSIDKEKFFIKEKPRYLAERHQLLGSRVILTVSRLSKIEAGFKGYDRVIESLPEVLEKIPNLKYLVVGEGDDLPRVRELVKKLSLENYVIFTGRVREEELVDYYNLADVFVMPSKCEGFGIVFLEALACGIPVIAGNKDASRETLLNGRLGQLIDPDSIKEISRAIVSSLSSKIEMKNREELRRMVFEKYGVDKFKMKVEELLTLLKNH